MTRLNPWHICDSSCYWFNEENGGWCNFDIEAVEADVNRPGCSKWLCANCLGPWDDDDHDMCMIIEVVLDN